MENKLYILCVRTGNWDEDAEICNIMISNSEDKLIQIGNELKKCGE